MGFKKLCRYLCTTNVELSPNCSLATVTGMMGFFGRKNKQKQNEKREKEKTREALTFETLSFTTFTLQKQKTSS